MKVAILGIMSSHPIQRIVVDYSIQYHHQQQPKHTVGVSKD
jgi:hypothetical protein